MYDSDNYASSRLNETIVLHKRTPVLVKSVHNMLALVRPILNVKRNDGYLVPLEDLNVTDLKLGYVNVDTSTVYLARRTLRHDWRQGLRSNNVHATGGFNAPTTLIAKALLQRYPSFKYALAVLQLGGSCAFSSEFALGYGDKVLWRDKEVGVLAEGTPSLYAKFKFLLSSLMEASNECVRII